MAGLVPAIHVFLAATKGCVDARDKRGHDGLLGCPFPGLSMNDAARPFTPRVEDEPLVTGRGRFVDDDHAGDMAFGCFVRSPHAHARILAIDTGTARSSPGVLAVLTAADMRELGSLSRHPPTQGRHGTAIIQPHRPALAGDIVRHVGEAVALVVATSATLAQDAAELVSVDYDELPAVAAAVEAVRDGAPQIWPQAPGNLAFDWPGPQPSEDNEREVERIIATAARVARITVIDQRITAATLEPRGATARFDPASGAYTLRVCSQGPGFLRDGLLPVMGLTADKLRVITEDVGGAFGMKTPAYPEYPALLVAAKTIGRPVHWMSTRSEAFVSDNQARDMRLSGELALDASGRFLALRVRSLANLGAYVGAFAVRVAADNFARCFPGQYRIPKIDIGVTCAFTNSLPTAPYRGAGRPEANYLIERLVEEAARVTGLAPEKIRRKNLIPRSAIPYKTAVGTTYDSGDFTAVFDKALAASGYAQFATRKREAYRRGRRRGIGISCFLEHAGGVPTESAALRFPADGTLTVALGVHATGQGHATIFSRLAAERLGIAPERVRVRQGDTALAIGAGAAATASRTTIMAGAALVRSIDILVDKGKRIAAQLLEAAESDVVYADGAFAVAGTDRRLTLFELADRAAALAARGDLLESLDTSATVDTPQAFPNGCHIAEVEIDPDTGVVRVVAYTAVDDGGNILDHTLAEGQIHGGIAQGLGQALLEQLVYDADGQLVTGSFVDYGLPRATDMPPIAMRDHPVPATTNPLGVKGVGEAGTIGSLAAIMNAIADAVGGEAGARLDMPATPEKIWRACRSASA
jgi:carbon-monoxide dehydrogenase large subunit